MADGISDWTRDQELKREAANAPTVGPAEPPPGAGSSRRSLVVWSHGKQENRTISALSDLQTQFLEEEPVIREGSLKVSVCAPR